MDRTHHDNEMVNRWAQCVDGGGATAG